MKHLFRTLFCISIFSVLFSSCSNTVSKTVTSKSENGDLLVSVWGVQPGTLEPWKIYIATDYKSDKDTVTTELHADKVDASNVKFNWNGNSACTVSLVHRDGKINPVPIKYHIK